MLISYGITFCRWAIGLVFVISCTGKLHDITAFANTINRFQLLPDYSVRLSAWLILAGEALVIVSLLVGGPLLAWGFLLATLLLLVFCFALISVSLRRIQTPCNCFGASSKSPVSSFEIIRSLVFSLCAMIGYGLLSMVQGNLGTLGIVDWSLSGIIAAVFVLLMVRLREFGLVLRLN